MLPRSGGEVEGELAGLFLGGRPLNVAKKDAPDHHTPDFYVDEGGLRLGMRAMTALALNYLRTHRPTAQAAGTR